MNKKKEILFLFLLFNLFLFLFSFPILQYLNIK